ncbi:MAG: hypothetical protein JOY85_16110, partial [Acidobacteriaceae bacterium]|nr:hypothetical protein [Acidobacteriaceae bacterium]
ATWRVWTGAGWQDWHVAIPQPIPNFQASAYTKGYGIGHPSAIVMPQAVNGQYLIVLYYYYQDCHFQSGCSTQPAGSGNVYRALSFDGIDFFSPSGQSTTDGSPGDVVNGLFSPAHFYALDSGGSTSKIMATLGAGNLPLNLNFGPAGNYYLLSTDGATGLNFEPEQSATTAHPLSYAHWACSTSSPAVLSDPRGHVLLKGDPSVLGFISAEDFACGNPPPNPIPGATFPTTLTLWPVYGLLYW